MPAVALTDHGSLAGAIEFYREARKQGGRPVIGSELYVCDDRAVQKKGNAHLTVLAATPAEALERAVRARAALSWS